MTLAATLRVIRRMIGTNLAGSLAYRGDFVFYMLGTIIGPIVSAFVWRAAIAAGADLPVDGRYLTTYFVLLSLVTMFASAWLSLYLAMNIREGKLSIWLARPGSFIFELIANNIGEKIVKACVLVPMVLVFGWFVRDSLALEVAAWRWGVLAVSVLLAAIIFFAVDVIMGSLGFWIEDIAGIEWGRGLLTGLLAGQVLPLALMPEWAQGFLTIQPFRYTISFPLELIVGDLSANDVLTGLGVQMGYTVLFILAARAIWTRGLRSYAAVGA